MKLTEQLEEIALRVAETAIIECDETWPSQQFIFEFAARFLAALPKPEPVAEVVKYGCHVDGDHDVIPNCVHDTGDFDDCTYAQFHEKKQDCPHWKPIKFATPPQPDDVRDAWQPIETAPKDGTAVLGMLIGSNIPPPMRFMSGGWVISWDHHRLSEWDGPTHWMPLPEAPAIAAAKGEV